MARKKKQPINWVRWLHGALAILFVLVVTKACNRGLKEIEEPNCYFDGPVGLILKKKNFRRVILRKNLKAFEITQYQIKIEFLNGNVEHHKIDKKCQYSEVFDR